MDRLSEYQQPDFEAVDDALKTYPMQAAPASILPVVMQRIETPERAPRFRLSWFDYAISLFSAGMAGLITTLLMTSWLTPDRITQIEHQVLLGWLHLRYSSPALSIILLSSLLLSLGLLVCAAFLLSRGGRFQHRILSGREALDRLRPS